MLDKLEPATREGVVASAKLASAWTAVGISSWAEAAQAVAFLYTLCLIGDFVWKKLKNRPPRRPRKAKGVGHE